MMANIVTAARWLARVSGSLALVAGALYWSGVSVPNHAHMLFGGLLVLALLGLAYGGRARAARLALLGALCALLIPVAGMLQLHLPWGEFLWAARLVHVAMGVAGIGLAESLAARQTG